jgi:succinylglutamic semialdehyde dehydrogenase
MPEHPGIFINHEWKKGSDLLFSSYNPATNDLLWQGHAASEQDIYEAVQAAKQACLSWAALTIDERSHYLIDYSEILLENQEHLAEIIAMETGKPLWDSKTEVSAMINKVSLSLEAYGRRCAGMIRDQSTARSITRHRPHGVVAVLGPYNFPGHLPNGHIIPALLAGNCVIFKPSELTPLVGEKMFSLWEQVGLPKGVLSLVQGGRKTGQCLAQHPQLQGLFFTGSYSTGLALSKAFGSTPQKILALEMGGNNPLVISEVSDVSIAAYLTILSAYLSTGQRCTCARRLILIENHQNEKFLDVLKQMIEKLTIGSYNDTPEPFMGPIISPSHVTQLLNQQAQLKALGGQPLLEMQALKAQTGFISPGLMDVTAIANCPDEEIFGPFLQIIQVKDFKSAVEEANRTQYGLTAGLFSSSQEEYHYFYRHIEAGVINWNTQLTGASSAAPFGGIKASGNFRPSAYYAADYCSYPVASLEASQLRLPINLIPGIQANFF